MGVATHVEILQTCSVRVKGQVIEISELLRNGVDVGHDERRERGMEVVAREKVRQTRLGSGKGCVRSGAFLG